MQQVPSVLLLKQRAFQMVPLWLDAHEHVCPAEEMLLDRGQVSGLPVAKSPLHCFRNLVHEAGHDALICVPEKNVACAPVEPVEMEQKSFLSAVMTLAYKGCPLHVYGTRNNACTQEEMRRVESQG